MSQENVAVVMRLHQGASGVDFARVFRDDDLPAAFFAAAAPNVHPDVKSTVTLLGTEQAYRGTDGFRSLYLDWYEHRIEVEDYIDHEDRVVALLHGLRRRRGSTEKVQALLAEVWTVRDGKASRYEFYPDRAEALGLEQ